MTVGESGGWSSAVAAIVLPTELGEGAHVTRSKALLWVAACLH
jgi:hypothetical protein